MEAPIDPADLEEIALTDPDLQRLQQAVSRAFSGEYSARSLLRTIGFPRDEDPVFAGRPREAWGQVFFLLEQGIVAHAPYLRLLAGALARFRGNRVLVDLARAYGVDPHSPTLRIRDAEPEPDPTLASSSEPPQVGVTCHVIVSAATEDARLRAEGELRRARLEPRLHWSTNTEQSFAVNSADPAMVRQALDVVENVNWVVVPPGEPDYLLRSLVVEGPDRRRFEVTDAPAQETIRDIAEDVLTNHYPQSEDADPPSTLFEVIREGVRRPVDPGTWLHAADIRDGDELAVSFQPESTDPTAPSERGRAFLCHSSGDKAHVRALHRQLTSDGIACWFDEADLLPGQSWELEIRRALRASRYVLVCLSRASVDKTGYVQKELCDALDLAAERPDGAIYLVPVRLEDCPVPERLRHLQWVDLFGEGNGYERLLRVLRF